MDKKQLLNLLHSNELKELAQELKARKVTASSSKKEDIEVLQNLLSVKELDTRLPVILKKRAARQRAQAISPAHHLSILHNYELERLARKEGIMTEGSLTAQNRGIVIKELSQHLSPHILKNEVESALRSRGRNAPHPSRNVVKIQECLYSVLSNTPEDLGAYELEKLIIDELPKSITEKGQKLELESNLVCKECQKKPFTIEYGGFEYIPSFRYGSAITIDIKFFTGMEMASLLPLFLGVGTIYRTSFNEVILFLYPQKTVKLGAKELEGLNTENIYIVN